MLLVPSPAAPGADTAVVDDVRARHRRLDALTSLRFLAALLVFGRHAQPILDRSPLGDPAHGLLIQGGAGVSFFFVLSGFVLAWSRPGGDRPGAFYRRRFARVYPSHLFTWVLAVAAAAAAIGSPVGLADGLASVFLVQAWIPDPQFYFAGNGVAWSLSCELFFYATFPLLIVWLARLSVRAQNRALVLVPVAIVAVAVGATVLDAGTVSLWLVKTFPLTRALEFVLGILVALALARGARPPVSLRWAAAIAVVGYLVAGAAPGGLRWAAFTAAPFALLIAAAAVAEMDGGARLLRRRALIRLGEWSFAFYLIHQMLLHAGERFVFGATGPIAAGPAAAAVAVGLVLAVAASAAMYQLLERPAERRLRGARRGRRDDVVLVSSSGGHLELLVKLRPAFADRTRTWFTSPSRRADELRAEGEDVRELPAWDQRTMGLAQVLRGCVLAARLRPRTVVTSGAGMAVPFCVVARLFGARLIFVETMARIGTPSLSGRILSRLARRVLVQWDDMSSVYPRATVCRPALLEGISAEPARDGAGTFVAVGTHNKPFDRLLQMVDEAVAAGVLPGPVLAQSGVSDYEPRAYAAQRWLTPEQMSDAVAEHRFVVCHGGSGVVSAALRSGRRPIVVPRVAEHDEHVDDHQVDAATKMAELGLVVRVGDGIAAGDLDAAAAPLAEPQAFLDAPALVDELRRAIAAVAR